MQMHDGENRRTVLLHDEEHAEWKSVKKGPAEIAKHERESERPRLDSSEGRPELVHEFGSEAFPSAVVP